MIEILHVSHIIVYILRSKLHTNKIKFVVPRVHKREGMKLFPLTYT